MRAHDVAIELRHLSTRFEQEDRQDRRSCGLPGAAKTREPDTESLAVSRWIRLGQDFSRLRPREPRRQETPLTEEFLAHLGAGDRCRAGALGNVRGFLVAILIREIEEFREGHHGDADLVLELPDQLLSIIRSVEWLPVRIFAWSGMVAADDHVVRAVIAPDDRMPEGFTRPSHAHRQRQE